MKIEVQLMTLTVLYFILSTKYVVCILKYTNKKVANYKNYNDKCNTRLKTFARITSSKFCVLSISSKNDIRCFSTFSISISYHGVRGNVNKIW